MTTEIKEYREETDHITNLLRGGQIRFGDIKQELLDNYEEISTCGDDIGRVMEMAESWLPIYYNEILIEWGKMPQQFTDSWQEMGYNDKQGIFDLMLIDIAFWYSDMGRDAWAEILEEKEDN